MGNNGNRLYNFRHYLTADSDWPCHLGGISAEIRPRKHPYDNTCYDMPTAETLYDYLTIPFEKLNLVKEEDEKSDICGGES